MQHLHRAGVGQRASLDGFGLIPGSRLAVASESRLGPSSGSRSLVQRTSRFHGSWIRDFSDGSCGRSRHGRGLRELPVRCDRGCGCVGAASAGPAAGWAPVVWNGLHQNGVGQLARLLSTLLRPKRAAYAVVPGPTPGAHCKASSATPIGASSASTACGPPPL